MIFAITDFTVVRSPEFPERNFCWTPGLTSTWLPNYLFISAQDIFVAQYLKPDDAKLVDINSRRFKTISKNLRNYRETEKETKISFQNRKRGRDYKPISRLSLDTKNSASCLQRYMLHCTLINTHVHTCIPCIHTRSRTTADDGMQSFGKEIFGENISITSPF